MNNVTHRVNTKRSWRFCLWFTWCVVLFLLVGSSVLFISLPIAAQTSTPTSTPTPTRTPTQTPADHIYIPLVPVQGTPTATPTLTPSVTPIATVAPGTSVYGLVGTLSRRSGPQFTYTYYLATAGSGLYALAGQTPDIEQQIAALARSSDAPSVKVWGTVQQPLDTREPLLIVVTGILAADPVVPTPATAASAPTAVVKFQVINLYGGPGSTYPVVGQVVQRQACEVTGRNQPNTWLQLTCADGQQGWVDARLVDVNGNLNSVVVITTVVQTPQPTAAAATATPTPTSQTFAGWRTELYNNTTLAGTPVAVVDIADINFDWGSSGPSQVGADGFSIRFQRRITVPPAFYQLTAVADDGIRVWIDGRLVINAWPADPSQTYVVGQVLTGSHDILVEYYEQSGLAKVRFDYSTAPVGGTWLASYYYGVTPTGNPAFTQQEPRGQNPLEYNWAGGSPISTATGMTVVGNDYWSARWQGTFPFESGNYVFRANVDDGLRLYLDGLLVIDQWRDGYKEVSNRVIGVGAGQHSVTVEYYERSGNASIQVWWYRDSPYLGPQ